MRYDDPNVPLSAVVGLVGAILLFVTIVALQAVFNSMQGGERSRKVYEQPYEALQQLDADQVGTLSSYGWVDQQQGVDAHPDRARDGPRCGGVAETIEVRTTVAFRALVVEGMLTGAASAARTPGFSPQD